MIYSWCFAAFFRCTTEYGYELWMFLGHPCTHIHIAYGPVQKRFLPSVICGFAIKLCIHLFMGHRKMFATTFTSAPIIQYTSAHFGAGVRNTELRFMKPFLVCKTYMNCCRRISLSHSMWFFEWHKYFSRSFVSGLWCVLFRRHIYICNVVSTINGVQHKHGDMMTCTTMHYTKITKT